MQSKERSVLKEKLPNFCQSKNRKSSVEFFFWFLVFGQVFITYLINSVTFSLYLNTCSRILNQIFSGMFLSFSPHSVPPLFLVCCWPFPSLLVNWCLWADNTASLVHNSWNTTRPFFLPLSRFLLFSLCLSFCLQLCQCLIILVFVRIFLSSLRSRF